ncbi:MAG TPA: AAA family ATPase [Verrucomicrobiota bacterium]|nr:AAA family ATPase [Verrucomicrobiota bacterium]HNS69500.1 AAA family ATPase [Verrucomicrobiota bacterium]
MADAVVGNGHYGSHHHILEIERLTGGRILAAPGKKCRLEQMWFHSDTPTRTPQYFINCPFPPSILTQVHRDKELAIKPGFRHDLLLDLEKKKLVEGEWVKNEEISLGEKRELLTVLDGFPWIAWAGMTPHGVHAAVYFNEWIPNSWSGQVVKWVGEQLEAAGYKGPVFIDWSPSVNCNRPSRYIDEFAFWRPEVRLDASAAVTESRSVAESRARSLRPPATRGSGSLKDQAKREVALRARANMKSATETALEVGETVAWVDKLWLEVPQEAWNPFNRDLQRMVGPRSQWGYKRQHGFTIHHNAAWSWEWCWSQKMDFETVKGLVFEEPIFEDILKELRSAWEESVSRNKDSQKTATWQQWVERDIERCYLKFGTRCVRKRTMERVKEAAIHTGKDSVAGSEIARRTGLAKSTVTYAFRALGVKCVPKGKKSYFPLPAEWIPDEAESGGPPLSLLPSLTSCVERKDTEEGASTPSPKQGEKKRRKKKLAPFEAFWRELAPALVELPCPVEDRYVREIEEALSRGYATHSEWRNLVRRLRKDNPSNLNDSASLSLLLQLVRASLSANGDVAHPETELTALLTQVLGEQARPFMEWLRSSGYIVDVSGCVGTPGETWLAWRYFLEGEARFAWRVIEHCIKGGMLEVVCGEPGTGKTQYLADKLVVAERTGRICRAGSALNQSAGLLRKRLPPGTKLEIKTLHKAFKIPVEVHELRGKVRSLSGDLLVADEAGQVSCDTAGVLAFRWRRGAEVVLSVGVGQNLPIGPGCVAEDLIAWLATRNLPGCKLNLLTENHRVSLDEANGIVDFFRAVMCGEILESFGPGMEVIWCNDDESVLRTAALLVAKHKAVCYSPTNSSVGEVNSGVVTMERCTDEADTANPWEFMQGEPLVVKNAGAKARQAGLRNGDEVEVAAPIMNGFNPKATIRVRFGGKEAVLLVQEVERAHSRTGHSTQGAESGVGIISLIQSRATTRRWLYTAVSRCRKKCVLVATRDGLKACLANNPRRRTCLSALLNRAAGVLFPTE